MSITTLLSMLVILGFIVGGFIYFLWLAIKNERKKGS